MLFGKANHFEDPAPRPMSDAEIVEAGLLWAKALKPGQSAPADVMSAGRALVRFYRLNNPRASSMDVADWVGDVLKQEATNDPA